MLSAHIRSDYQRKDLLSQVDEANLLAAIIELCPHRHLDSLFFFCFVLQRLPRVLMSKEDPKDIAAIWRRCTVEA
jgi:hypothetical protein